jgi:hypothetical protein
MTSIHTLRFPDVDSNSSKQSLENTRVLYTGFYSLKLLSSESSRVVGNFSVFQTSSGLEKPKTIVERRGGHPKHLLDGPSNLSSRDIRRNVLMSRLKERYQR